MTWQQIRQRLIKRRERLGLSQRELAAKIGTHQTTISTWERGWHMPSAHNLIVWAEALGLRVEVKL